MWLARETGPRGVNTGNGMAKVGKLRQAMVEEDSKAAGVEGVFQDMW